MKLVLVLLAVLVGIWLFKSSRRNHSNLPRTGPVEPLNPTVKALDMVRCRQCDLHLPRTDAFEGKQGLYCSQEHRHMAET